MFAVLTLLLTSEIGVSNSPTIHTQHIQNSSLKTAPICLFSLGPCWPVTQQYGIPDPADRSEPQSPLAGQCNSERRQSPYTQHFPSSRLSGESGLSFKRSLYPPACFQPHCQPPELGFQHLLFRACGGFQAGVCGTPPESCG